MLFPELLGRGSLYHVFLMPLVRIPSSKSFKAWGSSEVLNLSSLAFISSIHTCVEHPLKSGLHLVEQGSQKRNEWQGGW